MPVNKILLEVTDRIIERSKESREKYVDRMKSSVEKGPRRAHLSCGNQAHAYAAMGLDKETLANKSVPNIGIVSAYNDMLSAHQPFHNFPELIKEEARKHQATAQVAGGVPAIEGPGSDPHNAAGAGLEHEFRPDDQRGGNPCQPVARQDRKTVRRYADPHHPGIGICF